VKGYHLYRRSGEEEWKKIDTLSDPQKSGYEDEADLDDGKIYQYYLTGYDDKSETGPSKYVQARTKDLPPVPQDLKAQSGLVKSVLLSWTQIEDPDVGGYAIFRGVDGTNFERIAKVDGYKSDSFMDKGKIFTPLEDGKDYYYSVAGFNLFNAEGKRTISCIAETKPRPGNCMGFAAVSEKDHIHIRWDRNPEPDIKAYVLFRNKNDGFWFKIGDLDPEQTSYKDKNLKAESVYRYRIIVEDKDGLKSDPIESDNVPSPLVKTKANAP